MSKFISNSNLNKLSKALNDRIKSLVSEEKERAMEVEAGLQAAINGKANASHTHDDRYFTETEMNTKLSGKSDVGHAHDDMYYTETEIDGKISTLNNAINGKANASHTHDDRYYTETEIDGKIEDINESISSNVSTLEGKIATAKAEAISEAGKKDTALHTTISAEIDADVKVEKERAMDAENALQAAINGKANSSHAHDYLPYNGTLSSGDLDNIKTTGYYSLKGSLSNAPATGNASLFVDFTVGTPFQLFMHDTTFKFYIRNCISGSWGAWNTILGNDISGNAATATKVKNALSIQLNGGTATTFDGSTARSINITPSSIGAAASSHTHDDRYYTETEIDGKISDINDTIDGRVADLEASIAGKAASSHNHDDRYFTETEVTNKLAGKSDTGHTHNDIYYTETEIDGKISTLNTAINGKANASHTHDDRYYTETEINTKISDINDTIDTNVSTLEGKIATAKSGAISESKSYTDTAISKLVDSAPEAMNTLNELANAIGDHQTEYEAYVATVAANIATAKNEAIAEAGEKDTALHTTISAEIDADVKVEKERAMDAENALQAAINGKANASHGNHVPATQTADNTKFLRNDNTWATVTPGNIGAAPASHGNHVPATQTADNTKFLRNDNTWATVTPGNIGAAASSHTHDDRYYTETEINGKIEDINDTIDGHVADLNAAISGKAPSVHNHDDMYFTETEVTNKLAGKSDVGHVHDDRYYTETEIDGKISTLNNAINGKAASSHTHDDRYYTETEINTKISDINDAIDGHVATLNSAINGKAASNHTHTQINSRGAVAAETETSRPAVDGLSMSCAYSNGYPTPYGNVMTMKGTGDGQLLIGWSGTSGAHAPVYVRSKRDVSDANWSEWAQIYTTANKPTYSDVGAAASSHTHSNYQPKDNTVTTVSVASGKLTLTTAKRQKCTNLVSGTEIVFPTVTEFTEIHLYFSATNDMDLTFPDCKWRVDPNIEEGNSYEIVATYNTMEWLVNVIVYS